jgi:hypothetical protein
MSATERAMPVEHYIDPGFVNFRLVETVVGAVGTAEINRLVSTIPPGTPDWQMRNRLNHVYTRVALAFCTAIPAPTIRESLATQKGTLVCSTERFAVCPEVYDAVRVQIPILLDGSYDLKPEVHLSTEHISSSTTRSQLYEGDIESFIAVVHSLVGDCLILHPLIIGSPWLETTDPSWTDRIVWFGREFYEHYVDDFDQFARVRDVPDPDNSAVMQKISEKAFKTCLAEILGDATTKDWGGEQADHYSSHVSVNGKRVTAAFLLKGPARFEPMTLNNLGKNNDQIVRLASSPADVLVVQHCHDITPPVRDTLRAFAVQPSRPRRYCLIDGRDSLRLLTAYHKLERALELSNDAA